MVRADYLFAGNQVSDVLRAQQVKLRERIDGLDADRVLDTPADDLLDIIEDDFRVDCPVLRRDDQHSPMGAEDVKIDVSGDFRRARPGPGRTLVNGTRYRLHVPFDGEAVVFELRPNPCSMSPPQAEVKHGELVLTAEMPADSLDPATMRTGFDKTLDDIAVHLDRARVEIDEYNAKLRETAAGMLERRRKKVLKDREMEAFIGVPVARRADASPVLVVEVPRKRTPVTVQRPAATGFAPEPAVALGDFAAIAETIASFGSAAERFPGTFAPMGEEVLRELVLVVLNNQFGPSAGELFSRIGKTDIAILADEGPVFIAECKVWHGSTKFAEGVQQLLDYLVWRDTKAAMVLFVKNKNVTDAVEKAIGVLDGHERRKRRAPDVGGHPCFVLHHDGDDRREIDIALVVIPIPAAGEQAQPTRAPDPEARPSSLRTS